MNRVVICFLAAGLFAARLPAAEPGPSMTVFEGNVLCIRAGHLTDDFAEQLRSLQATNKIVGTVLDLRFADGKDQTLDAAVKLLAARKTPLAMLVNSETRGAAAELAQRLRAARAGILFGTTNVAETLAADIQVQVSPEDERRFLADPFAVTVTNEMASFSAKDDLLAYVDHTSEAELVRKSIKDGEDEGDEPLTPRVAPAQPVIRDPSLARAVDLLEALALLKPSRG
jgi:hypothetical protein